MLDTRTLALLAPRAGEPNLDRDAIQLADLRAALSRRLPRREARAEHPQLLFRGNELPLTGFCECGA
ncbi:MAG TPA: hypothetical protein VF484_04130 [Candidatus Limnocylindrales bacterium]